MHLITASKYMKQKLTELKGELGNTTVVDGDINILSAVDRASKQKNCKEVDDMKNIFSFPELIDICRAITQQW